MRSSESSIIALAVGARVATIALLTTAGRVLPAFDTSSQLQLNATGSLLEPLLRWDSLYFTSTALHGYQHEQQLAFMPGISLLARWGGRVVQLLRRGPVLSAQDVVLAGTLAAAFAGVGAALALHKLTLALHPSRSFALLTVVLFLLPPSPPTLNAIPYTEPFFALTTFLGMLLFVRHRFVPAALIWACGTLFRGQGIIMGPGFFAWHYIFHAPRARSGVFETNVRLPLSSV